MDKMKPEDQMDIASTLSLIGSINIDMGLTSAAIGAFEELLLIQIEVLGLQHADVAATLICIANQYIASGEHDLSLEAYDQSLTILKAQEQDVQYRDKILLVLQKITDLCIILDLPDKAIESYKDILFYRNGSNQLNSKGIFKTKVEILLMIGSLHQSNGRIRIALQYFEQADIEISSHLFHLSKTEDPNLQKRDFLEREAAEKLHHLCAKQISYISNKLSSNRSLNPMIRAHAA